MFIRHYRVYQNSYPQDPVDNSQNEALTFVSRAVSEGCAKHVDELWTVGG
jgi:hypothetical protein